MKITHLLFPAVLAALIAYALTPVAAVLARRLGAIDLPGPRKMHQTAIPRLGGAAVVPAMLITLGVLSAFQMLGDPGPPPALLIALTIGLLPIFVVSVWDDVQSVRPAIKLAAHLIGAAIVVAAGLHLNDTVQLFGHAVALGWLSIPLSMLWIVGITNAFNLVDGLDGVSAGLGLISAASLGIVAVLTPDREVAVAAVVVLGALAGFIPYNIHPARVFLGDSGATATGFYLACLALAGSSKLSAGMAVLVPVVVMGVPVADTILSVVRRSLRAWERRTTPTIFQGDTEHIHHRLVSMGLTYQRAVLILYGAGVAAAAVAIGSLFVTASNAALLLASLIGAAFIGVSRLGYHELAVLRRGIILKVYDSAVVKSGHFRAFVDMGLVMVTFYGAVALKYDDWELHTHRGLLRNALPILLPVNLAAFWAFRLYRRAWRFASIDDVISANSAVVVASVVGFVLTRLFVDPLASATLFVAYTLLLMIAVSAGRSSFRVLAYFNAANRAHGRRVVVYGAGAHGMIAVQEMQRVETMRMVPVGFIDDDRLKVGRRISGLQVLGNVTELLRIIRDHHIEAVILASDSITPERIDVATSACTACDVALLRFRVGVQSIPDDSPVQVVIPA